MSRYTPTVSRLRAARVLLGIAWETDRPRTVAAFVLIGVQALTASLFALWLRVMLNAFDPIDAGRILSAACGMTAAIAGAAAADYIGQRVQTALRDRTLARVDERLMTVVGRTPSLEIYENPKYLDQLHALNRESWPLGNAIPGLLEIFATSIRVVVATVLLAGVSPLLLVLPLFALPTLALSSRTGALWELGNDRAAASARLANHLYELATNPGPAKEVRLFRLAPELSARFHHTHVEIQRIHRQVNLIGQTLALLGRVIFIVGYFAAITYTVILAVDGHATIGDAGLTAVLAGQVLTLVTGSADLVQQAFRSLATVARFVYLTDFADQNPPGTQDPPARLTDGIRLDHVSYRYPAVDRDALHDISLHLPAGTTIAVVGDNGAGKSTLVKLIAGLYPPTTGTISIDDTQLTSLAPQPMAPTTLRRIPRPCPLRIPTPRHRRYRRHPHPHRDDSRHSRPRSAGTCRSHRPSPTATGRHSHPARHQLALRHRPLRRPMAKARTRPSDDAYRPPAATPGRTHRGHRRRHRI